MTRLDAFPISEVKNMRVTKQLFVVSFCMWSWLWLWEGPAYTQTGNAQRRGQGGSSANQANQLLTNLQAVYQTGAVTPAQQQAILNSLAAIFPRGKSADNHHADCTGQRLDRRGGCREDDTVAGGETVPGCRPGVPRRDEQPSSSVAVGACRCPSDADHHQIDARRYPDPFQ